MSTAITTKDLSKEPPHSPRERLGGFVIAARTTDKCRASMENKLGDYHYDCPLDNVLFSFKGINGPQFKSAVQSAKTYEEIGTWLKNNGTPKTDAEIKAWSDSVESASLSNDPSEEKRKYFEENCKKLGLDPKKTTTFQWLEADDKTVGKK